MVKSVGLEYLPVHDFKTEVSTKKSSVNIFFNFSSDSILVVCPSSNVAIMAGL